MSKQAEVLRINNLDITFNCEQGNFKTVSDVSFSIKKGEIFCLVGESGCGKSLTAKAILGLTPENTNINGEVCFNEANLLELSDNKMRSIRGKDISMIFQEPMTALNPVLRIGEQCMEVLILHEKMSKQQAKEHCIKLFEQVGIPAAASRLNDYPHQLSGGMRQRVMIAMALACSPQLLLADEPTTALDVTIQWQILSLIKKLAHEHGMGVLLITHNLGVVAQVASRVGVMYAGEIVEQGTVSEVLKTPKHPYTQGLLHAIPSKHHMEEHRLPVIKGRVPLPSELPSGCRFNPRCNRAMQKCFAEKPDFKAISNNSNHLSRCFLN